MRILSENNLPDKNVILNAFCGANDIDTCNGDLLSSNRRRSWQPTLELIDASLCQNQN